MNSRVLLLGAWLLLTGCAVTALGRAENALYAGRYDEAAARFQQVLAENPGSVDALVGLGIARYRVGALEDAERTMGEAQRRAPHLPVPDLYLGLIALLRGQDATALERLRRYAAGTAPRLVDDVERAQRALASGPVTPDMRTYMAASLEDQAALAGELVATQRALRDADLRRVTDDRLILTLPRACRCR